MRGSELQTKCIGVIENEYNGYVINVVSASRSGAGDLYACIGGRFYLFEVKGEGDTIKPLQKENINRTADSGGHGFVIRSLERLRSVLDTGTASDYFPQLTKKVLKL